jgi:hypothetical protein
MAMTNENAILVAKTIPDFFNAINQEYGLALPTDFSDDSPVSKLLLAGRQERVKSLHGKD